MKKVYIKKVKVSSLWNNFNIDWKLDSKVNVLIGKNGTGKSTILNIIDSAITRSQLPYNYIYSEVNIIFSNKKGIVEKNAKLNGGDFIKILSELLKSSKLKEDKLKKDILLLKNSHDKKEEVELKDKKDKKDIPELIKISTFDMELKNKQGIQNNNENINTELDLILYNLINNFKLYQLKLKNQVEKESFIIDKSINNLSDETSDLLMLKNLVKEKEEKVKLIFKNKNNFTKILNKLFKDTNKILDLDENNSIIFKTDEQVITPYQLSSGEKQMLIILLTIILKENKPFVLLMDEPEISLHVEWQKDFLDNLISLNPNMQIILATHSPAIVSKGWMDKVVNVSDIVSKVE